MNDGSNPTNEKMQSNEVKGREELILVVGRTILSHSH